LLAGVGNFGFVWLAHQPPGTPVLYAATFADQFGNGFAGAVFVVYLSMLVNPRFPGAQYAFLSGFAFLLPRLLAGASGAIQTRIGYDGFFLLTGALSLAAIPLLPLIGRMGPRADEVPA
jgi:PAT family beta-lactamase induction signal transducer AmpG